MQRPQTSPACPARPYAHKPRTDTQNHEHATKQTSDQTKPNQTKPNQTKSDQAKPNQTKPYQTKPKPNQTQTPPKPTPTLPLPPVLLLLSVIVITKPKPQESSHDVGVAVVELRVCERLTSSSEEVPAILTLITCTFVLGQAHRIAGRMTLANAFEVIYRVR